MTEVENNTTIPQPANQWMADDNTANQWVVADNTWDQWVVADNTGNQSNAKHWTITVIIKDPQWNEVWQFTAEDGKNIAELAAMHGVNIPVSCWAWVCWVCLCKVEEWKDALKADAFNSPLMPLKADESGNPEEVLTCIAWFKPEAFNDWKDHTIVLQRTY